MEETKEFTYSKADARTLLLKRRAGVSDRLDKATAAMENVLPLLGGNVMVYVPIGSEISTLPLIEALIKRNDVTVFAPYTSDSMITPKRLLQVEAADRYGNLPVDCYGEIAESIDACVTPLLGVDSCGYRLGYGKGCYDRFFRGKNIKKIGFCFSEQFIDFTHSFFDVPLDVCVTEKNVIYFDHASDCGKI